MKKQQFDFIFDKAALKAMEWKDWGRVEIGRAWQSPDGKTKRIYFRAAIRANRREALIIDMSSDADVIDEIARQWGWVAPAAQPEPVEVAEADRVRWWDSMHAFATPTEYQAWAAAEAEEARRQMAEEGDDDDDGIDPFLRWEIESY